MKLNNILIPLFVLTCLSACKKDFLGRLPETNVTEENTFLTPNDLEIYTNSMYGMIGPNYSDGFSDNIAGLSGASTTSNMVRGTLTVANADGWGGWESLRRINFMLDNVHKTKGDAAAINHFIGIARLYRANWYYNMVLTYGDVPWYGKVIKDNDEAALTKKQDPRTLVVDSIMADLEFAANNIKPSGTNTRITKWAALAMLSRIALYEGSYRKYHKYLQLEQTAAAFYEKSANAAKKIIDEGGFLVHNTGKLGEDYRDLFANPDLSTNKEVIFLWKNSKGEGVANNAHTVFDYQWALSKDLMEEYLMKDGTRFTEQPEYETKTITQIFTNRDPRLSEVIMPPGFKTNPTLDIPYVLKPTFGGYLQVKFYPRDPNLRMGWNLNYTDLPIIRYAEVLLNYAEARAELGQINQADVDATVGKLRQRVGMPTLSLATASVNVDPILAKRYPNVLTNKGAILEIRRERRTELAAEGFRFNDLNRWYVGELFAQDPKGMYVPALGAMDVTGDGIQDIAILKNEDEKGPIASLPEDVKKKLTYYYLEEKKGSNVIYLSEGTKGYVMFVVDKNQPRKWVDGAQYYYRPIPIGQIVLNPNLVQPFGWK
jgi:hypothetical protein